MNKFENNELYHDGIKGMKWGVRNGPPYPLDKRDYSAAEKKAAGIKKSKSSGSSDETPPKIHRLKSERLNYLDQAKTQVQYNLKRSLYDKREFIDKPELGKHNLFRLGNNLDITFNRKLLNHYENRINRVIEKYEKKGYTIDRKNHIRYANMDAEIDKYGPQFAALQFQRYNDLSINREGSIYVVKKRKKS